MVTTTAGTHSRRFWIERWTHILGACPHSIPHNTHSVPATLGTPQGLCLSFLHEYYSQITPNSLSRHSH